MIRVDVTASPYSAVGDGVTDDTDALQDAFAALVSAGGGELYFPPGTYLVAPGTLILFNVPQGLHLTLRGAGERLSTIRTTTGSATLVYSAGVAHVLITELGLDLGDAVGAVGIYTREPLTYRHGRVTGFDRGTGVHLDRARRCVIAADFESSFGGGNARTGTALKISGGWDHDLRDVRIWGAYDGIKCDGATKYVGGRISASRLRTDGLWPYLPTRTKTTGSGFARGTPVSWTDTGFTVTAGDLPDNIPESTNVRALWPLASGTVHADGCVGGTLNAAAGPDFTDLDVDVTHGDYVLTAAAIGIVTGVVSATELRVEGWLSRTTLQPIAAPTPTTAWTLYRWVGYGVATGGFAGGGTSVLTNAWRDMRGRPVTGAALTTAGATYEVLIDHPNYQCLHAEAGYLGVRAIDVVALASWSDQLSGAADFDQYGDVWMSGGWDTGITRNGRGGVASNFIIRRQGVRAIYVEGVGAVFADGVVGASPAFSDVGAGSYDGQVLLATLGGGEDQETPGHVLANVVVDGESTDATGDGSVDDGAYPLVATGVVVGTGRALLNAVATHGHRLASVKKYGDDAAVQIVACDFTRDAHADGEVGRLVHFNSAVAQTYKLRGDGPPPDWLTAIARPGTLWTEDLGGGKEQLWRLHAQGWGRVSRAL